MSSISPIYHASTTVAAQAGIRYLIVGCNQSVQNGPGGTGEAVNVEFTINGSTKNDFALRLSDPYASTHVNQSFYVPPLGILCDVNTAITIGRVGVFSSYNSIVFYREVTV